MQLLFSCSVKRHQKDAIPLAFPCPFAPLYRCWPGCDSCISVHVIMQTNKGVYKSWQSMCWFFLLSRRDKARKEGKELKTPNIVYRLHTYKHANSFVTKRKEKKNTWMYYLFHMFILFFFRFIHFYFYFISFKVGDGLSFNTALM